MSHPTTLTVVCGWPMSGKSSVAKGLSLALDQHWIAANSVWALSFGTPLRNPVTDAEKLRDSQEVGRVYQILLAMTAKNLELGRSLVITAPFSRVKGFEDLKTMLGPFPDVVMKVVWCKPTRDDDSEIEARLQKRLADPTNFSSVTTRERYLVGRGKYDPVTVPHLKLDTSPPFTVAECVEQARQYVLS